MRVTVLVAPLVLGLLLPGSASAAESSPTDRFDQSSLLSHLPETTATMVWVDLEQCRALEPESEAPWTDVVVGELSRRFRFEEHDLDLKEVRAMVFFEDWDGKRYGRGWLIDGPRPEDPNPSRIREFPDGTFAVGPDWVLARLQARDDPRHMRGLLSRLDTSSPILGVCRHPIALTIPTGGLFPAQVELPGIAFALQLGFGEKARLYGKVIASGAATEAMGEEFLAHVINFVRPLGSAGPGGRMLAKGAGFGVTGDSVSVDVSIPRETLSPWREESESLRMIEARGGLGLVVLPDGRVIAGGGFDGHRGLTSLEVIDPRSGRTQPLDLSLSQRRIAAAHSLIAGRELFVFFGMEAVGEGMVPSAEALNLITGEHRAIAAPPGPGRIGATATALPDGRILLAGGALPTSKTAESYLFDPASGAFTPLPDRMSVSRGDHAAVLMPDGSVLLAGGVTRGHTGPATDTIERFDPATGRFQLLEIRLPSARTGLAGTALHDGRVVLLGGMDQTGELGDILVMDDGDTAPNLVGQLESTRYYFAAVTLPDGRVLVAGGGTGSLSMRHSIEIWDPSRIESNHPVPTSEDARRPQSGD